MTLKKNKAAQALGRKGGKAKVSKGPLANKTPEERAEWAAKMVEVRRANAAKREAEKENADARGTTAHSK